MDELKVQEAMLAVVRRRVVELSDGVGGRRDV